MIWKLSQRKQRHDFVSDEDAADRAGAPGGGGQARAGNGRLPIFRSFNDLCDIRGPMRPLQDDYRDVPKMG